ncbi:S8 family serine peptidase [Dactylosporangium roseum]|uniref:S8 family serine peptidase n=1 Tax=Dactylosporangium roseum TaxID=47989 RepID=A0ABY5ZA21_9ACTN|nr:S8 family serine peptidase [Dactylosporangium roseum]UWZ37647.1 S8 family serine peptidase [Dactylosporangium roseum]
MKQPLALAVVLGTVVVLGAGSPASADVIRDDQWHLKYLKVAEANQRSRGDGVTVAIVDNGVDRSHPDLTGGILDPVFVTDTPNASGIDDDGHGTALAGLIAGRGHPDERSGDEHGAGVIGVAPGARILPVVIGRPASPDPDAGVGPDQLADGIALAVRRGAKIIVVGYSVGASDRLRQAVRDAQERDAIVVASDGNQPSRAFEPYPAAYDGVLAAVPLTRAGDVRVRSDSGRSLGLGVPGDQIMTTNSGGGYRVDDGSASVGLLAGAVALLRSAYPGLSAPEIVRRLALTAVDAGAKGPDREYGLGRLDLVPALTRNLPAPSPSASPQPTASASPSPEPQAAPKPPRSRGQLGWLLSLPLVAVIAVLALYAVRSEQRISASTTGTERDGTEPDQIDSVRASS